MYSFLMHFFNAYCKVFTFVIGTVDKYNNNNARNGNESTVAWVMKTTLFSVLCNG